MRKHRVRGTGTLSRANSAGGLYVLGHETSAEEAIGALLGTALGDIHVLRLYLYFPRDAWV